MKKGFKSKLHLLSLGQLNAVAETFIPEQGAIPLWIEPLREREKIPPRWMLLIEVRHAAENGGPDNKTSYLFEPAVGICQSYTAKTYGKAWVAYAPAPFIKTYNVFITENAIEGIGDYGEAMVEFYRELSRNELKLFRELLIDIRDKATKRGECLDTDAVVQDALSRFRNIASGRSIEIAKQYITF